MNVDRTEPGKWGCVPPAKNRLEKWRLHGSRSRSACFPIYLLHFANVSDLNMAKNSWKLRMH